MKKIVSLLAALSLTLAVWGQNTLDRPLTAFPTEKATHLKCQDAWKLLSAQPLAAPELVTEALMSGDRVYSNAVLEYADETAGPKALVKTVKKLFPTLPDAAKADVLYWIGRNKLTELQKLIDQSFMPGEAGDAAVFAATQIGGEHNKKQLEALMKDGSPLFPVALRLSGKASGDDADATRTSLMNQK